MGMQKTYIGYARVSTEEQNEARQLESFRTFREPISKTFIDKCSGKNMNRPQLKAMMEYVREGDVVVVSDFSRLARSTKDMLQIVQDLSEKGVGLISMKEHLDYRITDDPREEHNLAAEHPEIVKEFDQIMHRMHKPSENYPIPEDKEAKK